jgi:hypothetical protein
MHGVYNVKMVYVAATILDL